MNGPSLSLSLSLRRDPVRLLFSRGLWRGIWYLLAYQVVGWVLFAVAFGAALTGAILSFTLAGLPLLIAAAATIRWGAQVERARLRLFGGEVRPGYRAVAGQPMLTRLRSRWRDPATWRDIAYLIGLFVPLVTLGFIVLTVWLVLLAGITLPAWCWAPWQSVHGVRYHGYQLGYFPNGLHGHPGYGVYVDSLPKALLSAGAFLILFLLFNYVLMATARAHVTVARGLLGPRVDPLHEAREVLSRPGPLAVLTGDGLTADGLTADGLTADGLTAEPPGFF